MPRDHKLDNDSTRTIIEWSEFHYHLFSHLISSECPRELAEGIDLYLFPNSWIPDSKRLEQAIAACIQSTDNDSLNRILTMLLVTWNNEGLQANGPTIIEQV